MSFTAALRFAGLESQYSLNSALARNLATQGFGETTDVQTASLPLLLGDNKLSVDLITVAPTGSGKTLGFLVPLIHKIALDHRSEGSETGRHTRAVILSPTKELEIRSLSQAGVWYLALEFLFQA